MKKLVLASILSTAVGAGTVAATAGGPFHLAFTLPHSFYSETWSSNVPTAVSSTVTMGVTQFDYILTDVVIGSRGLSDPTTVLVNGQAVAALPGDASSNGFRPLDLHLNTGIRVPAGSTIALQIPSGYAPVTPVTITGYYQ